MAPAIAILMTCHNRRALTRRCLESLATQPLFAAENLFLVDDGSSDGTGDMVRAMFPAAHVIAGGGDLFWNGGMRLAWDHARKANRVFDYYLWLNDDVVLRSGALDQLVDDAVRMVAGNAPVIVTGSTVTPGTDMVNYGGQRRLRPNRPLRLTMIKPSGMPQMVDTFSGNIVLVSNAAERQLGNLDPTFEHIYGDLDYGYRATARGISIILSSAVTGECDSNAVAGSSLDPSLGRRDRVRLRLHEERKVHARDWRRFARRHSGLGPFSMLYTIAPYVRLLAGR